MRRLAFALSLVVVAAGAIGSAVQWSERLRQREAAERRLPADTPLIKVSDRRPVRIGEPVARLRIPAIGVDEIVVEGIGPRQLARGLGHYPSSADLGAPAVAAVAGHRTGWGDPLLRLDALEVGDPLAVSTADRALVYRVTRMLTVAPSASWVLRGDRTHRGVAQLVITTCTPPYTSLRRLVVWALLDQDA